MKNYLKILTVFLAAFMMFAADARAQCSAPWQPFSWQGSWLVNGVPCDYIIRGCYYIDEIGVLHCEIYEIDNPEGSPPECIDELVQISAWVDLIYDHSVDVVLDLIQNQIPPCSTGVVQVAEYDMVSCWRFYNKPAVPGQSAAIQSYRKCPDVGMCRVHYNICWDYSFNPPYLRKTLLYKVFLNEGGCSNVKPTLPPQGYTWDQEWYGPCYYYLSVLCNY